VPFDNLTEQERVFAMLDELANQPNQEAGVDFSNPNYVLMRRLYVLSLGIHDAETSHGFDPEKTSYQRALVNNLIFRLEDSNPACLLSIALPTIKELLYKAWVISLEMECGRLVPLADVGVRSVTQLQEMTRKSVEARTADNKTYSPGEKAEWLKLADEIKQSNSRMVSARGLALAIIKKLQMSQSAFESVRTHLAANGYKKNG